jgi:RNA polymerase sigma-70 factor (ECF subfamily)
LGGLEVEAMDCKAFDLALVNMSGPLRQYFRRRVYDPVVADDLAQETLLKVFRSRATIRDETRLKAWVYQIAHCTLGDFNRRPSTLSHLRDDTPQEQPQIADDVRAVLACSARCYLGTLPATYRLPVHLAEYEGLSHGEIAQKLGLSLAATKSRVRRGKLMVRNLMEAQCQFEYDRFGKIIAYQVRSRCRVGSVPANSK